MMFPWNIAKSAEAVFSRWAVKRVFKFLLKKKLGQFILGDIDLDQLDVQLKDGTIQLSDLALNVDYLNDKFGAASSFFIKEGSIGSLLVKMPWKGKGCQVEVEELELIIAHRLHSNLSTRDETCSANREGSHSRPDELGKVGKDSKDSAARSTSTDVHEGVKTIAKMVKWLLTSFHVRIKKLIVAYDPCLENDVKIMGTHKSLVLRISEIECGTCVSEDSKSNSDAKDESFLDISQLSNFVKFQGAIVELLHMDIVDNGGCSSCTSGSSVDQMFSESYPPNCTTPIITGKSGSFSGSVNLSIPWKDGSLDIRKVDANVFIDPLELRFQPSTMSWFILLLETYKSSGEDGRTDIACKSTDSVYFNSNSHFHSSVPKYAASPGNRNVPSQCSSRADFSSLLGQESATETILPGSRLIQDWVPYTINKNQKDDAQEVDFGSSMDQFFECFDGMRSSQSALGSSGMWNWTSSVFTAITAASSLASGSLDLSSEQQHAQTNVKATFAGISVVLFFHDDDNQSNRSHYLVAESSDIHLAVQVCPHEMSVKGSVKHVVITEYLCNEIAVGFGGNNTNVKYQTNLIKNLQAEVHDALPPFDSAEIHFSDKLSGIVTDGQFSRNQGDAVRTMLLRASGVTYFQLAVNSHPSDGCLTRLTSFSLNLSPIILWLNFNLISMLLDLSKEIGKVVEINKKKGFLSKENNEKHGKSHEGEKKGSDPCITTLSSSESMQGNISIPTARIIMCFPFETRKEIGGNSSWDQFVALDFSSPTALNKGSFQTISSQRVCSSPPTHSLHLSVGNLNSYLVTLHNGDVETQECGTQRRFSADKILYVINKTGCLTVISMHWQDGHVTGPWIAEKAKFIATLEESRRNHKFMGKGYEFATVTTVKDLEDIYSQTRKEIILSSSFALNIHLFSVTIHLNSSQYSDLNCLLDQLTCGLSSVASHSTVCREEAPVFQTSILVECESVEILIRPEIKENIINSMQSELPGTWQYLKLRVQKFDLMSVSNIGGIYGADFFWLAHGEGKLWGSVSGVSNREFPLIVCSNSSMKRGDGGGSNALSSRLAGSDIIYLSDPESSQSYTSIAVRCSTIVAVGGRLDWFEVITSFFCLPCSETHNATDISLQKGDKDSPHEASFVLNFVDIGLSYEPHLKSSVIQSETLSKSGISTSTEEIGEPYTACLLAASSVKVSNTTVADSVDDHKIQVQDLGLLLSIVSDSGRLLSTYSAEYLRETGYVKVAQEALVEATVRTNCGDGLLWEVNCSKSHISLETCYDSTFGLIRLASQLQKLFAPDVEETIVHLQNRWNSFQQAEERKETSGNSGNFNHDSTPSTSGTENVSVGIKNETGVIGLMDEISENAFHLDTNQTHTHHIDSLESQPHIEFVESSLGEGYTLNFERDPSFTVPTLGGPDCSQTSFLEKDFLPELIETYCLSELRPLSELSAGKESSGSQRNRGEENLKRGDTGWYGDASLKLLENHISEMNEQSGKKRNLEGEHSSCKRNESSANAMGRVLLKNINLRWKIYEGSDWHESRKNSNSSTSSCERDTTVCLELSLCGMQFQYDIFPAGGVCVSKLSLSILDFHLYDRSEAAPWKLVLGYYNSKDHPRESSSKAFKMSLESVRPDPVTPLEEYRLRIGLLPVLLHLHQTQLDFLTNFFGGKNSSVDLPPGSLQGSGAPEITPIKSGSYAGDRIIDEAFLPYFQKFDVWPVVIRVDYSPQRVDLAALRSGKYVELVNLVPWKGVELELKHVHAAGIYGWGNVCETIAGEWLIDISQNQIHKVLRGIPTVRSLFAVGAGAAKLVSLPVESYKKDKRILKGMQRGTIAFLRSISLEAVGLGVHLAAGAHDILVQAEYVLTSIPPSLSLPRNKTKVNVRYNQPKDAQQGIVQAYESISDGLGKSASALVRTPLKKYQRGASAGSALASAVRAVPAAAISPASACASAVHYALLGIRNSLDPERKKESMEKYLGPNQPQNKND